MSVARLVRAIVGAALFLVGMAWEANGAPLLIGITVALCFAILMFRDEVWEL